MILYKRGGANFFLKLCQCKGSVFPFALCVALPCSALSVAVKVLVDMDYLPYLAGEDAIMNESSTAWRSFSFLVGFLVVFRTSQAYSRFWDGCTFTHQMRAEWFIACSSIIAFCKHSHASKNRIRSFQECIVRLFSMLHAVALAEIEDVNADCGVEEIQAFKYELIDVEAIDATSLETIKESDAKVELVFHWIQQLIVENIESGVLDLPAPILTRCFQKISDGMVHFHDAIKISNIPFPFPYAQTCDCLLMLHWLMTPVVVATGVTQPYWSGIFSFFSVFILWALNAIAVEIENPFGMDANDIDTCAMQLELNKHLILLLDKNAQRTPFLTKDARDSESSRSGRRNSTFISAWKSISLKGIGCNEKIHRSSRPHRPRRNSNSSRDSRDTGTESIATTLEILSEDVGTSYPLTMATGTTSIGEGFQPKLSDITIHSTVSIPEVSEHMLAGSRGDQDLSDPEWNMPDPGDDSAHVLCMPRSLERDAREPDPSESNRSERSSDGTVTPSLAAQVRPASEGPGTSTNIATAKEGRDRHKPQRDIEGGHSKVDAARTLLRSGSPLSPTPSGPGLGGWAPAPCAYAPPEG